MDEITLPLWNDARDSRIDVFFYASRVCKEWLASGIRETAKSFPEWPGDAQMQNGRGFVSHTALYLLVASVVETCKLERIVENFNTHKITVPSALA